MLPLSRSRRLEEKEVERKISDSKAVDDVKRSVPVGLVERFVRTRDSARERVVGVSRVECKRRGQLAGGTVRTNGGILGGLREWCVGVLAVWAGIVEYPPDGAGGSESDNWG